MLMNTHRNADTFTTNKHEHTDRHACTPASTHLSILAHYNSSPFFQSVPLFLLPLSVQELGLKLQLSSFNSLLYVAVGGDQWEAIARQGPPPVRAGTPWIRQYT
jgi:hypothetical protein